MEPASPPLPDDSGSVTLPIESLERIHRVCLRFEEALKAKRSPRIEDLLGTASGPERDRLVLELVSLEVDYRVVRGERPSFEEYAARFPAQRAVLPGAFLSGTEGGEPFPPEDAPTQVGPYKILEQLGEGGMGVVYLAEQREPVRRRVALKVIKQGLGSREIVARFEAERQALALMDHPNIARVHDAGTSGDGRPYFAMEHVAGVPITEYADRHRLTVRKRLELFVQVCEGIQHAHHRGVIHRDIKPSNILVSVPDEKPVAKIIDFGVARAINQRLTEKTLYTEIGRAVGTPAYMSPEQAEMSAEAVDHRTDVYSLGVLLYELLVDDLPLDREVLAKAAFDEIIRSIREEDPPTPSTRLSRLNLERTRKLASDRCTSPGELRRELRGDLDWITMRAMEKDRSRRFASAGELAKDVERYLHGEPVLSGPPGLGYRVRKFLRKNRRPVAAAAAVMAALTLGLIGSLWFAFESRENARLARENETTADERTREVVAANVQKEAALERERREHALAEKLQREAEDQARVTRRRLYDAHMRLASQSWDEGHDARVLDLLSGHIPKEGEADLRRFEWYYLFGQCHADAATLRAHVLSVYDLAFSPDGKTLATAAIDGVVHIWEAATQRHLKTLSMPVSAWSVAFSPDGKTLAVGQGSGVQGARAVRLTFWDVESWTPRLEVPTSLGIQALAFSPDGGTLAAAQSAFWGRKEVPGLVDLFDPRTGEHRATLGGHTAGVTDVEFAPDGRTVATSCWDGRLRLYSPDTGELVETLTSQVGGHTHGLCISPDGSFLATVGTETEIWDLPRRKRVRALRKQGFSIAVSPDGARLAVAGINSIVHVIDIASGEEVVGLRGHREWIWRVAFSPDGRWLASGDRPGFVKLWDLSRTLDRKPLRSHSRNSPAKTRGRAHFALSPDGRRLALARGDHSVAIHDVATGEPCGNLEGHSSPVHAVLFSADGARVVTGAGDGAVSVWDPESGRRLRDLSGHSSPVTALSLSADGAALATASVDRTVRVWDAPSGEERRRLDLHAPAAAAALSPDGRLVAAAIVAGLDPETDDRSSSVRAWETATGKQVWRFRGALRHGATTSVDQEFCDVIFSGDGARLVAAIGDPFHAQEGGVALVLDAGTGEVLRTLRGHFGFVTALDLASGDETLVTAGAEGTFRLWDATNWEERGFLRWQGHSLRAGDYYGHGVEIDSVAIAANGRVVAIGAPSGEVALFRAATPEEVARQLEVAGAWRRLERGIRASDDREHAVAVAELTGAIETEPAPPFLVDALGLRAGALLALERWSEALADWSRILEARPRGQVSSTAAVGRAVSLWNFGDRRGALRGFVEAFSLDELEPRGEGVDVEPLRKLLGRVADVEGVDLERAAVSVVGLRALGPHAFARIAWSVGRLSDDGDSLVKDLVADSGAEGYADRLYGRALDRSSPGMWRALRDRVAAGRTVPSRVLGLDGHAGGSPDYEAVPADGALLTGLEVTVKLLTGIPTVVGIRPVFVSEGATIRGPPLGTPDSSAVTVYARPGFAVGGITAWGDGGLRGIQVRFLRIRGVRLDPADGYWSEPWGERGPFSEERIETSGDPVVGVVGVAPTQPRHLGIGLVVAGALPPDLESLETVPLVGPRIVPAGARWRMPAGGEEPPAGWTEPGFDDGAWEYVPSAATAPAAAREASRRSEAPAFRRLRFEANEPRGHDRLVLEAAADCGFVAFLNGEEVARVEAGRPESWMPFEASLFVDAGGPALGDLRIPVEAKRLRAGENVLAVRWDREPDPRSAVPSLRGAVAPLDPAPGGRLARLLEIAVREGAALHAAYLEGRRLELGGRPADAVARFEAVVDAGSSEPAPWLRLVDSLAAAGRPEAAEERLRRGLAGPLCACRRAWDRWLSLSFGELGRGAAEALGALPATAGRGEPQRRRTATFLDRLATGSPIRIDCGGRGIPGPAGEEWLADGFHLGGTSADVAVEVAGAASRAMHATERFFLFPDVPELFPAYRIPLPRGRWAVALHVAEGGPSQPAARLFDVVVEREPLIASFEPGAAGYAVAQRLAAAREVIDGALDIELRRGFQNPAIAGIEVRPPGAGDPGATSPPSLAGGWHAGVDAGEYRAALRLEVAGGRLVDGGRPAEAEAALSRSASLLEGLVGRSPAREVCRRDLGRVLARVATAQQALGEAAGAERSLALARLVSWETVDGPAGSLVALVPPGDSWRFFRGRAEPSPGLEWTKVSFDDGAWESGPSGFGYGDGDDATVLSDMRGAYTTVYIRRTFEIEDPADIQRLELEATVDDGFVAYLNGREVGRAEAGPEGMALSASDVASRQIEEAVTHRAAIEPALLHAGANVLALQGLNGSRTSSDLSLLPVLRASRRRSSSLAADLLRTGIAAAPAGTIYRVDYARARLLALEGKPAEAVEALWEICRREPTAEAPRLALVRALRASGRPEEAIAALEEHVRAGGEAGDRSWELWHALALVELRRGLEESVSRLPPAPAGTAGSEPDILWALRRLAEDGVVRIDCGARSETVTASGVRWGRDRFHGGPTRTYELGFDILGTEDDPVYWTERYLEDVPASRATLSYRVPVAPGTCEVTLRFAELYWREPGLRVFDILLEGEERESRFEPLAAGLGRAIERTFAVEVEDGWLEIELRRQPGSRECPNVSAIEVRRAG